MAKKQFKTESKRILDLMINSIYTNKEIFLRELISNASDAIDKLHFRSLTDQSVGMSAGDFEIRLCADKAARTLSIEDNGIGMSKEELENNLGTIARSGSLDFVKENADAKDLDIIGQFGVGFYSAFMVAKNITVVSRAFGSDEAYKWESAGADGYTIAPCEKQTVGTIITLELKDDTDTEKYSDYLEQYKLSSLIKKYSDYIRYPIKMDVEKSRKKEGGDKDEYEQYTETETLNSMVSLWKRPKKDVTDEDYKSFYKEKFYDFTDPLRIIHQHAEGTTEYYALLFIPEKADYNFYSKEFERGLSLYSSGVMIMEKCADLLPEYFGFVKGLVDSQDLSLNISREMLQQDAQLRLIRTALEKRIKKELVDMLENDRESYKKFWQAFGQTVKFGIYKSFGAARETLEELLMFKLASDGEMTTLKEYRSAMSDEQKYIYYAAGSDDKKLDKLPQCELVRDKGFDVLYFTDEVDEFLAEMLHEFDGKELRSVTGGDLGLESDEEKNEKKELEEQNKDLFGFMKEALDGKVSDVRLSSRLKSHPVCLTADGSISLEMEKVLGTMPGSEKPKANKVLELNGSHPVFERLRGLYGKDDDKLKRYAKLLYDQALLIEGFSIDDPVEFSNSVCELMQ